MCEKPHLQGQGHHPAPPGERREQVIPSKPRDPLGSLKQHHGPLHPPVSPASLSGRAVSPLLPSRDLGEKLGNRQVLI